MSRVFVLVSASFVFLLMEESPFGSAALLAAAFGAAELVRRVGRRLAGRRMHQRRKLALHVRLVKREGGGRIENARGG